MDVRRALRLTNGFVDVRPVVLLAAKALGPGSVRLEMVKLAHELNERRSVIAFEGGFEIHSHEHQPASQPERGEIRKDLDPPPGTSTPDGGKRF
jgi:hypothetical protein